MRNAMTRWLLTITEFTVAAIDIVALIVIVIGTLEAFVSIARAVLVPPASHILRSAWLRYAHWLVAGLTFQLGADIIETSIAPTWDDVGRLAAIAAIRTFLNYFLERDVGELGGLQSADAALEPPALGTGAEALRR
jgi:uncharacterized membrane protein